MRTMERENVASLSFIFWMFATMSVKRKWFLRRRSKPHCVEQKWWNVWTSAKLSPRLYALMVGSARERNKQRQPARWTVSIAFAEWRSLTKNNNRIRGIFRVAVCFRPCSRRTKPSTNPFEYKGVLLIAFHSRLHDDQRGLSTRGQKVFLSEISHGWKWIERSSNTQMTLRKIFPALVIQAQLMLLSRSTQCASKERFQ